MAKFTVPPVDPAWDYVQQWELLHHMKYLIEDSIIQMGYWDEETKETNQTFHEFIQEIQKDATRCVNLTDFHTTNLDEMLED